MQAKQLAVLAGVSMALGLPGGVVAQEPNERTVPIVQVVGCGILEGSEWFLTQATEPTESETPYASDAEIEEARGLSLGSNRFHLIGVAEFLDLDGLLGQFDRADFTAPESANATGQLVGGNKLAIKGLYLADVDPPRINLTSVIRLADSCS